jgi:sec-independent protein translocase protein TatA
MPQLGPMEFVIIAILFLMIFGVGRLPEVGSAIGKSVAGFRQALDKDGLVSTEGVKKREEQE